MMTSLSLFYGDLHIYNRYISNIFILVAQQYKLTHLFSEKVLRFYHREYMPSWSEMFGGT